MFPLFNEFLSDFEIITNHRKDNNLFCMLFRDIIDFLSKLKAQGNGNFCRTFVMFIKRLMNLDESLYAYFLALLVGARG